MYGIIAGIVGLVIGSFLNVVIYRLPRGESIIFPGSHCTTCNAPIHWYHNIPVLSYIALRGKCASCKASYSIRYPLVEALTGGLFFWGFTHYPLAEALLFCGMTVVLITITFVDMDHMIIPFLMILLGFIFLVVYYAFFPDGISNALWGIAVGVGYLGGVYLLTRGMFHKETMGMGDLQLIAVLGAWLGPFQVAIAIFAGSLFTLFGFMIVSALSRFDRDRALPFGPFLAGAGVAVYMFEPSWIDFVNWLK